MAGGGGGGARFLTIAKLDTYFRILSLALNAGKSDDLLPSELKMVAGKIAHSVPQSLDWVELRGGGDNPLIAARVLSNASAMNIVYLHHLMRFLDQIFCIDSNHAVLSLQKV